MSNSAMREALESVNKIYDLLSKSCIVIEEVRQACREARAVLIATPLRNCDVGTAEEQADRFGKLCIKYYNEEEQCNRKCPLASLDFIHGFPRCQAYWTQMPYEEGDAE